MNQYKIAFVSLGCAKNLVNTEQMMALCRAAGHTVTGEAAGADVAVLNTCGFIDSAKAEAISHVLELAELKAEGKLQKLLVAGCLSQRYRDDILEELPEIDGILGTGSYVDVVPAVEAVMAGDQPTYFGDIDHTDEEGERVVSTPGYTAYLKIAEGCDHRCAYCIIPFLRGRYRSRPMESVLAEAKVLADSGVQELIVVAQDTTRYGMDLYQAYRLPQLLTELCKLPFRWIRLHYLYPDALTDELIDVIAREEKVLNYIDIPIQHISDGLLRAMRRGTSREQIVSLLEKLRARLPGVVLRTSIIAGLPGEGEAEFEELCSFLREAGIQRAGIFQFSPEEGTEAVTMDNQVEPDIAKRRVELLCEIQAGVMDLFNESRLGETVEVLCEGFDSDMGCYGGRTYADSPDVDGKVFFTAPGVIPAGRFVQVHITGVEDGDLMGEME